MGRFLKKTITIVTKVTFHFNINKKNTIFVIQLDI